MRFDAREVDEGTTLQADVCIVGGGAAGITLALALRDKGLDILLLEGGGAVADGNWQDLYKGQMSGLRTWTLDGCRFRQLGGSTVAWAGWCRPLDAEDFDAHDWMPHSGWPISRADLDPFYVLAHDTCDLADFEYDVDALSTRAERTHFDLDPALAVTSVYHYSPPTRFNQKFGADLDASQDVALYLNAGVVDIVSGDDDAVDRVEVGTLEGKRFFVESRVVVLATGGIENARLLLAANGGTGIANGSDTVGRYFMEHPHYYGASLIVSKSDAISFYQRFQMAGAYMGAPRGMSLKGALAIAAEARAAEGIPNMGLELNQVDLDRDHQGIPPTHMAQLVGKADATLMRIHARVEQRPLTESRITLSERDRDALGMPRAILDWRIAREDLVGYRRGFEILGAAFGKAGIGRVWASLDGEAFKGNPQPGCHHMGATRMSADAATGVVDANLRCHEVPNLYVLGSSVFPTGGYANPTLTIVALAHRLALQLHEELT